MQKIKWNMIGLVLSMACAVHCIITPVLLIIFPFALRHWQHEDHEWVEWSVISISFVIGSTTLIHAYKKHYHKKLPLILFCISFICILIAIIFLKKESVLFVLGSVLLASTFIINYWYLRKYKSHCSY